MCISPISLSATASSARKCGFCITSEGITPHPLLIRTHASDQILSTGFGCPYSTGSLSASNRQSLLVDGPSRPYLCNPYKGAWTLTPQCFFCALTRFFPKNVGLTLDLRRSAHQTASAMQLQQSTLFRGCSHFVMFRLPCLLDPQVATHR